MLEIVQFIHQVIYLCSFYFVADKKTLVLEVERHIEEAQELVSTFLSYYIILIRKLRLNKNAFEFD